MKYCFIRTEALAVELTGAIYKGNFVIEEQAVTTNK